MWVYLALLVCTSSGQSCFTTEGRELPFAGLAGCQIAGEMMAPSWEEQHPGWKVSKIRCTLGKRGHAEDQT